MNTAIFGSAVQRTLKLSTRAFTHELAVFPLSGICGTGVSSAIILLQYEFQGSMTVRTQMAQVQVNTFLQSLSIIKHHSRTSLVGGAITILKNISQWEGLSHTLWKIKHVPNHQPDICSRSQSDATDGVLSSLKTNYHTYPLEITHGNDKSHGRNCMCVYIYTLPILDTWLKHLIFSWQKWICPLKSQKNKGFGNYPCKVDRLFPMIFI